jgi:hypothetical protein
MRWSENARKLGYRTNYVVDGGKARVILSVLVTPGEVSENRPMLDLLFGTAFRWKIRPHHVTADGTYGTAENIEAVEHSGIHAYLALHEAGGRVGFFRKSEFAYDAARDLFVCPAGETLRALGDAEDIRRRGKIVTYRARGSVERFRNAENHLALSLVPGAGQRFESAHRLFLCLRCAGVTSGLREARAPRPELPYRDQTGKRSWSDTRVMQPSALCCVGLRSSPAGLA